MKKSAHANVAHRCLSHAPSAPESSRSRCPGDDSEQKQLSGGTQNHIIDETKSVHMDQVEIGLPLDAGGAAQEGTPLLQTNQNTPPPLKWPLIPQVPERSTLLEPLEDSEKACRHKAESRGYILFLSNITSALIVFFACISSYESLLSVALSVGMTLYVYFTLADAVSWSMDWVLLGFAVVTPMSISIGLAFQRRELALRQIAILRSSCFQLYLAHASWDWGSNQVSGRQKTSGEVNWQNHADQALGELIGMADELCRFLTLPSFSRARHRVTPWGRHEASGTVEVAYRLWDTLLTCRVSKLTHLTEVLKKYGMPGNETSRIRQWERFVGEAVEQLRILKTYRTPQALRSFARLFTIILPAFYSPDFAQLARDSNSIGLGVSFAVLTSFALSALFESIYMLEDPFVAHLSLDGIDVHEELRVLHWHQLVNARQIYFPNAPPYVDKFSLEFVKSPKGRTQQQGSATSSPHCAIVVDREEQNRTDCPAMTRESSYAKFGQALSCSQPVEKGS